MIWKRVLMLAATVCAVAIPLESASAAVDDFTVDVTPNTDLLDGQNVSVTITGMPLGTSTALVECVGTVADIAHCDVSTLQIFTPETDPVVRTLAVRRSPTTSVSGRVACGDPDVNCTIGVQPLVPNPVNRFVALNFVPSIPGVIHGVVTDPEGKGVAGATVHKFPCAEGIQCLVTTTAADGSYQFDGVTAGVDIEIRVEPVDGSFLMPEPFYPYLPALEFALNLGATVVHDVELGLGGRVTLAAELHGEPINVGQAMLCNDQILCWDAYNGAFFQAVPPGEYELWGQSFDGEYEYINPPAVPVTVVAGATTDATIVLQAGRVHGRVTEGGTGEPITDAFVHVTCSTCGFVGTVTDGNGEYSLWLSPNDYELEVSPPNGIIAAPQTRAVTLADGDDRTEDFELTSPPTIKVTIPGAAIVGVDACQVGESFCDTSRFAAGQSVSVPVPGPGRYDLFVDAVVGGGIVGTIITDVEAGVGVTEVGAVAGPDTDRDGVPDSIEVGDRDGNGTPDADELGVVTTTGSDGSVFTARTRDSERPFNVFAFSLMFAARAVDRVPPPPAGVEFPHGVVTARANLVSTTVLTVVMPEPADALYALTATGWERMDGAGLGGATINGSRATLRLFDGGPTDLDGAINGRIQVDVAPASDGAGAAKILTGPVGFVGGNDAAFEVDAPDGAVLRCSLDLTAFAPCSDSPAYAGLGDGGHVLVVQPIINGQPGVADFRLWYAGMDDGPRFVGGPTGVTESTSAQFTVDRPSGPCLLDFAVIPCDELDVDGLDAGPHFVVVFDRPGGPITDLRYWSVHRPASAT